MGAFKLTRYVRNPEGGSDVPVDTFLASEEQLTREMTILIKGRPTFVDLQAPNGDLLSIGVGGSWACVMFASSEMLREGSTMNATGTAGEDAPEWVEFESGGTPTPISREMLLRPKDLLGIAKRFFTTGDRHPEYTWE